MAADQSTFDQMRGSRVVAYSTGAVTLAAGLVLLFWPDRTITVVARLTGILVVVVGVADLVDAYQHRRGGSYGALQTIRGVLNVGFGFALVFWPHVTVTVLVWIFGISLVLTGALGLVALRRIPGEFRRPTLIRAVVTIVFGLLVLIWPSATLQAVALIVAALLIAFGLILLWSGYLLSQASRTATSSASGATPTEQESSEPSSEP
jgi:uncharacterized membrane protein HdeD (DUF308 family)